MKLPDEKIKAISQNPDILLLYGLPKVGKTTSLANLENSLIIDFENGTNKVDAVKVNVDSLEDLSELIQELKKNKGKYKYGIVDTATKLEELAGEYGISLYKKSSFGSKFNGDIEELKSLPMGSGYGYIRKAYKILMNSISECFDYLILCGHTKDKIIIKEDKEISSIEIDLTGKLAGIVSQKVDAIGYVYRKKNDLYISFKTDGEIHTGNRSKHLSGKDILISSSDGDNIETYWEKIYID